MLCPGVVLIVLRTIMRGVNIGCQVIIQICSKSQRGREKIVCGLVEVDGREVVLIQQ